MKLILWITVLLTSSQLSAANVKLAASCQEKLNSLIIGLENVLVDIDGAVQGDYPKLEIDIKNIERVIKNPKRKKNPVTDITVDAIVGHINEDNETWRNNYRVKLFLHDGECDIESYSFLGSK